MKLSLSMINTSTGRVIAPHTVENAPLITDWLQGINKQDPYMRDELRVILLGEIAGVAYDNHQIPDALKPLSYGVLSCIWRKVYIPGWSRANRRFRLMHWLHWTLQGDR